MPNIHIFGASGSGTSTLGEALAQKLGQTWLDTDNFYWVPTDPPFTDKHPIEERLKLLEEAFAKAPDGWVLSGALESWGSPILPKLDYAIFIYLNNAERMKRLAQRSLDRHGEDALPGGACYPQEKEFQEWAKHYESGHLGGRSLKRHEAFIKTLPCPLLRLRSEDPVETLLHQALDFISKPRT